MSTAPLIAAQILPFTLEEPDTPYGAAVWNFTGRLVRDRFNQLNKYSKFNWCTEADPIPEPDTRDLALLMDERAQELLSKHEHITVQWSGGVDSTAVLLSLIKHGIKKDNLKILCATTSEEEYPKLYEWLKAEGYDLTISDDWFKTMSEVDTDLITNGWCADQLFGSMHFYHHPDTYFLDLPSFLKQRNFKKALTEDSIQDIAQVYKQTAKNVFDVDLEIAAQLGWFINFTMKWTWTNCVNELYLARTKNEYKTKAFFDSPTFQGWSLAHYGEIIKSNGYGSETEFYKRPLKEYSNSIFADEDYLKSKGKFPSWNAALDSTKTNFFRFVAKTTKGKIIMNYPKIVPRGAPDLYVSPFFTRFLK